MRLPHIVISALFCVGCQGKPAKAPTGEAAPKRAAAPKSAARIAVVSPATLPPLSADPLAANEACADCHPDEVEGFRKTGMGRSLSPVKGATVIETFDKAEVTHEASGFVYRAWRDADGRFWQEERLIGAKSGYAVEATWIIGSGNNTRSYMAEIDGELVQLPLTWYAGRKIWDMSPGYVGPTQPRFSRLVEAPCLFCHNGLTPLKPGARASYARTLAPAIGCNRCHGDGAEHVAAREGGKGPAKGQPDPSIFNPGREDPQRQLQICQQCHLQADASVVHGGHRWDQYDPRLPLHRYASVFRKAGQGDAFTVVSHSRRLALSACSKVSKTLTCTSCHDPHAVGSRESYQAACQSCHGGEGKVHCADARGAAPDADCAHCHMRSGGTSDVPHVTFTDHFIRKKPSDGSLEPPPAQTTDLVDLVIGAAPLDTPDARIRVGLAHTFLWERLKNPAHLPEAISTLESALASAPPGTPGLARGYAALGRAYVRQERIPEALQAMERARALDVDDPQFPDDYAETLRLGGRLPEARAVLQAAIARHPSARRWFQLGVLHMRSKDMQPAIAAFETAARMSTYLAQPLAELGSVAMRAGDAKAAREHLEEAVRRDPTYAAGAMRLALLDLQEKKPEQAAKRIDPIVTREPDAAPAWLIRAQARALSGHKESALNDFAKVIELAPDRPEGYVGAASMALELKREGQATAWLTLAAGKFPKHPQVLLLLERLGP